MEGAGAVSSPALSTVQSCTGSHSLQVSGEGARAADETLFSTNGIQEVWFYDDGTMSQDLIINSYWVGAGYFPTYSNGFYFSRDFLPSGQPPLLSTNARSKGWH